MIRLWLGNNHRMHQVYSARESGALASPLQSMCASDSKAHVLSLQAADTFGTCAVNAYWLKQVRGYVSLCPSDAASALLRRLVHFFRPWPNRATTGPLAFWLAPLWVAPVMGFALRSLSAYPQARDPLLVLPVLLGLFGCLPYTFHMRFRSPFFGGYLAVMAAPSILMFGHKLRRARLTVWPATEPQSLESGRSHPNRRLHPTRWSITALAEKHGGQGQHVDSVIGEIQRAAGGTLARTGTRNRVAKRPRLRRMAHPWRSVERMG